MKSMNFALPRNRAQGFSLIEIIVVITIIGVIVGWAASNIFGKADQAQAKIGKSKIVALSGPLDIYKLDTGKYPSTAEGLKALVQFPVQSSVAAMAFSIVIWRKGTPSPKRLISSAYCVSLGRARTSPGRTE